MPPFARREIERHLKGARTILDVGGATGAFSIPLAKRGFHLTHLDLSPEMAPSMFGTRPKLWFEKLGCNLLRRRHASRLVSLRARIAVVCLVAASAVRAQSSAPSSDGLNHNRILGVIPNYQTVDNATPATPPLTPKQKWFFFLDETKDPFNIAAAALSAGLSQADNQTPKYGEGGAAYAQRFGAAMGDFTSQNLFSDAILACLLHQDPRYFRRGPKSRILPRVAYSLSRIAVARQDSGRQTFNASGVFGMALGIGASNLYYPSASRTGTVMATRVGTSLAGWALGNVAAEFWPDIHQKFFPNGFLHRKAPQPPLPKR